MSSVRLLRSAGRLYATTTDGAIFATDDALTWSDVSGHLSGFTSVGKTVLASYGSDIYGSQDDGQSWSLVEALPPGPLVLSIAATDGSAVALTRDMLYVSDDLGLTWVASAPAEARGALRTLGVAGEAYLASTDSALLRSTDAGHTWLTVAGAPPGAVISSPGIASSFLRASGNLLYRSDDDGASWKPVATGAPPGEMLADLVVAGPDLLVALVGGYCVLCADPNESAKQLWLGRDGGMRWEPLGQQLPMPAIALAVHGETVVVGTDGAGTWTMPLSALTSR